MTLRTGLLTFLALLAAASSALYFAVSRTDGMGIPGGRNALEQALTPYVEDGSLRFAEPRIALRQGSDTVEMTLRNLAFKTPGSSVDIALEGISADIDGTRLTKGMIRFRAAQIARARLIVDIDTLPDGNDQSAFTPKQITQLIDEAYRSAFSQMGLGRLSKLTMDNVIVSVVSGAIGLAEAKGTLTLQPVGESMQLASQFTWTPGGETALEGTSSIFVIGGPDAPLNVALALDFPVIEIGYGSGDVALEAAKLDLSYQHNNAATALARVSWQADSATLADANLFNGARRFGEISGLVKYDAQRDEASATIEDFPLGDASFSMTVQIADASEQAIVTAKGALTDLSTADLKVLWPLSVSKGGRAWVTENITDGLVPNADIQLNAPLANLISGDLAPDAFKMAFTLEGVTAQFLRPMPPLVGAQGSAVMTLEQIAFSIVSGQVNGVDAAGSTVLLSAFSQPIQLAEIDLRLLGSSTQLAQALDSEPLGYFSAYDLDPNALSGDFAGRALLKLPLLRDVLLDDIVLSARIDGQALKLANVAAGEDVSFSRTVIEITQDSLNLRGDITMDGAQAALRWKEDFSASTETPTAVSLVGQLDPLGVARWMPGLAGTVFGTVFFETELTGRGAQIAAATIKADLTATTIDVPELGYNKAIGEMADVYVSASSTPELWRFDAITLNAPDLLVIADGAIAQNGSTAILSASTIEMPALNAALNLSKDGSAWLLAGRANTIDVGPLLNMFWAGELTQSTRAAELEDPGVLSISLNIDEVSLLSGQTARAAKVLGTFQGERIRQLNVFGQGPAQAPFTLTIEPIETGRRLLLASQSAGELANGLGMFATATGGQLTVQATSFERGEQLVLAGLMEMSNVRLLDTPVLAQLLGLGSLTGVADLARDRGLNFETVEVPFELVGGVVRVTNASAKGPALGLTANGEFLDSLEQADIRGVIVPSYTINSALGRVPVIGDVLIGGPDGGLFGINYRIAGSMDEPEMNVNPASMLTPGFLRGIFGDQRGRLEDVVSQPLAPQAAGQTTFTP